MKVPATANRIEVSKLSVQHYLSVLRQAGLWTTIKQKQLGNCALNTMVFDEVIDRLRQLKAARRFFVAAKPKTNRTVAR
ncbi:hypothetical protein GCM10023186_00140 [Hymenobacter koreensis]|uniref:Uncharacterized protein n=2 Tax=Hymenobacter koreensis TaxID=1084523 RepID=A0ABP8IT13_9BACT